MLKKKLDRRRFLKASGAGLTGLTLLPHLSFIAGAQTPGTSERHIYSLNHGWLFSEKGAPGATKPGFSSAPGVAKSPHCQTATP